MLPLTLLHSERPKLNTILAFLSAIGLRVDPFMKDLVSKGSKQEVAKLSPFEGMAEIYPCVLMHLNISFIFYLDSITPEMFSVNNTIQHPIFWVS